MPNHIKNRLKLIGTIEQIQSVFEKHNTFVEAELNKTHNGDLIICRNTKSTDWDCGWFNPLTGEFKNRNEEKCVGLPEGWEFEINQPVNCFPDFDKIIKHPDCDEYNDIPSQEAVRNHANWWMTWNRNNWGTKWNGYSYETIQFGIYTFETAWSGVPRLMQELSRQNPEIEIEYTYADEDTGCNVGKFKFKDGQITSQFLPSNCSKEAYDIAFDLRPYNSEYYELVDGNYQYKNEEE